VHSVPLTEQCKQSLDSWEKQGTFDASPETFRRWLRLSSYGVYVVAGSMFLIATGLLIGLIALLRPSFATKGDEERRLSWGKVVLYAVLIGAVVTGAAALAHWLDSQATAHAA
jgi:hypothetical protein